MKRALRGVLKKLFYKNQKILRKAYTTECNFFKVAVLQPVALQELQEYFLKNFQGAFRQGIY